MRAGVTLGITNRLGSKGISLKTENDSHNLNKGNSHR